MVHYCSHNCNNAIKLLTITSMPTQNYSNVKLTHPWVITTKLIERGISWILKQWLLITITALTELQGAQARGDAMRVGISRANQTTRSCAIFIVYLNIL